MMQKEELIQVHNLLCQLKKEIVGAGAHEGAFAEYASLGVSPLHVHRSKADHKRAIFTLGKELAKIIGQAEFSGPDFVRQRFETFAARVR